MSVKLGTNVGKVEDLKPIPNGDYEVRLEDYSYTEESEYGPLLDLNFKLIDPGGEFNNRTLGYRIYLPMDGDNDKENLYGGSELDAKLRKVRRTMEGLGLDPDVTELPENRQEAIEAGWIGQSATARVKQRTTKDGESFPAISRFV